MFNPFRQSSECNSASMSKWLSDNGFQGTKVAKVLVLGNSGAGKSFLCNALIGSETFEHKTRATSVTSTTTFAAVVMGDTAYIICNIPGLIEADQNNIPRNKAAIEAAFDFQRGCPTVALLVVSTTGGRVKNEDYEAIRCVRGYVKMDPAATVVVVNGVDKDEIDGDFGEYERTLTSEVKAIVDAKSRVGLTELVGKTEKADYLSEPMRRLQGKLVQWVTSATAASMTPLAGSTLALETEKLEKAAEEERQRMAARRRAQEAEIAKHDAKQAAEIAAQAKAHAEAVAAQQLELEAAQNQPQQVVYVTQGGGGGGGGRDCVVC
jgi:predicted GTPase